MIWFIIVIAVAGVLLLAVMSGGKRPVKKTANRIGSVDRELVSSRWREIEEMSKSGGLGLKGAITEGDKLLDYVMRQQGTPGETMAERLKRAQARLSDKEAVWQAHKLRNHLNHEVSFDLVASQAREAIQAYGQAIRDLGAMR